VAFFPQTSTIVAKAVGEWGDRQREVTDYLRLHYSEREKSTKRPDPERALYIIKGVRYLFLGIVYIVAIVK
jgi:hypothetical protein